MRGTGGDRGTGEDTPDQGDVDLDGERVILKARDAAEQVGQEDVHRGDGDGREVLYQQAQDPGDRFLNEGGREGWRVRKYSLAAHTR